MKRFIKIVLVLDIFSLAIIIIIGMLIDMLTDKDIDNLITTVLSIIIIIGLIDGILAIIVNRKQIWKDLKDYLS